MFGIRCARAEDRDFWIGLDAHLPPAGFEQKVRDRQGYIILDGDSPAGVMRYNLFWDSVPFLTLIYLGEGFRRRGLGAQAVSRWEAEMRSMGHTAVMTSTQADEQAQHFYRKLGYRDAGCLILDLPGLSQPLEVLMIKPLE